MYNKKQISILGIYVIVIFAYSIIIYGFEKNIKRVNQLIQNELSTQLSISIETDENNRGAVLADFIQVVKAADIDSNHMVVITEKDTTYTPKGKKRLSLKEKISKAKQTVLYNKNPLQISEVDSLFTSALKENGIQAKTVMHIRDNLKETEQYSGSMEGIYKTLLKEPIQLGARNELTIQVYYAIPVRYILSQIPVVYWCISGSGILILIALIYLFPRRKQPVPEAEIPIKQTTFYPEEVCQKLTTDLFYHPDNHQLIYKEELFTFSGQSQRLLHAFISHPYHLLSLDEMKQQAWQRKEVTDDAVRIAVSRLKKEIVKIPSIHIITLNGAGYRMEFILYPESKKKNEEEDSPASTINSTCPNK